MSLLRRAWPRIPMLVVCAAATTAIGFSSTATAAPLYGVQGVGADSYNSLQQVQSQLNAIQKLHVSLLRVEVSWAELDPVTPGVYDRSVLASIDRLVNGAAKRHIRIVMFVDRTPCWASSSPSRNGCRGTKPNSFAVTRYPPTDPTTYVPVSTFLAARYGKKLAAFEVWNEPDQINQKYWAGPDKINRYVALVKAVYGPLKKANPSLQVLVGSFVGTNGVWLQLLYNAGIKGYYDGLAVHFYVVPLAALRATRAVQHKNHDSKPLWLTEFGWTSCYAPGHASEIDHDCVTAAGQTHNLIDTMRAIRRVSWVRAAIIYELRDETRGYHFGLMTATGALKRAYTAVLKVIAGVPLAINRPSAKLQRVGTHALASGTASGADEFTVNVSVDGHPRETATLYTNPLNRWHLSLPKVLGVHDIRITITGEWTGHASATLR